TARSGDSGDLPQEPLGEAQEIRPARLAREPRRDQAGHESGQPIILLFRSGLDLAGGLLATEEDNDRTRPNSPAGGYDGYTVRVTGFDTATEVGQGEMRGGRLRYSSGYPTVTTRVFTLVPRQAG
ncbi:MAG: hypothetical protein V3U13_07180, partial [Gemmatimonadota bacterium]